jgi:hypothetical protein
VSAAGCENDRGAGVDGALYRVELDDGLWMLTMELTRPGTAWLMVNCSGSWTLSGLR